MFAVIERRGIQQVLESKCVDKALLLALGRHDPNVPGIERPRLTGNRVARRASSAARRPARDDGEPRGAEPRWGSDRTVKVRWGPPQRRRSNPKPGNVMMIVAGSAADLAIAEPT